METKFGKRALPAEFHPLTLANYEAVAEMLMEGFADEPMSISVGHAGVESHLFMLDACRRAAQDEATSGRQLSVVAVSGSQVVGAVVVVAPHGDDDASYVAATQLTPAQVRLIGALDHMTTLAKDVIKPDTTPELLFMYVWPSHRGWTAQGVGNLCVTMLHLTESKVQKYFDGLYSHSNDVIARRQVADGWIVVVSVPYKSLPSQCLVAPVDGNTNICYRRFSNDAATTPCST